MLERPSERQAASLELRNLRKAFGDFKAVQDVSLQVAGGEFISLLGPSGCGKTTVLRMIAGLERPDSGSVLFSGKSVDSLPARSRNVGMVFQSYALFPHMRVCENVAFGLKVRGVPIQEIKGKVQAALEQVKMSGMSERFASELSGGQRQRVALARALVTRPMLLLLDEPLGALDRALREEMQFEIRGLQQSVGITTLCVTHDQEEALILSDRIAVMDGGKVQQVGTPKEIYERPATRFVSEFVGRSNRIRGAIRHIDASGLSVECALGVVATNADTLPRENLKSHRFVEVTFRPENMVLGPSPTGQVGLKGEGPVRRVHYLGNTCQVDIEVDGVLLSASIPSSHERLSTLQVGSSAAFFVASGSLRLFPV